MTSLQRISHVHCWLPRSYIFTLPRGCSMNMHTHSLEGLNGFMPSSKLCLAQKGFERACVPRKKWEKRFIADVEQTLKEKKITSMLVGLSREKFLVPWCIMGCIPGRSSLQSHSVYPAHLFPAQLFPAPLNPISNSPIQCTRLWVLYDCRGE